MERTKILFIETGSGFGGTGKYLFDLVSRIDQSRFEPFVIYCGEGTNIKKVKQLDVPLWQMDLTVRARKGPLGYFYLALWFLFWAVPNSIKIKKVIEENNIDLVYLNNEILSHIPSIMAARGKAKIICHNHGLRHLTSIEKHFAKDIDTIICVSEATAKVTKQDLGNEDIRVVHNGLNVSDYKLDQIKTTTQLTKERESSKLIGMVGRIVKWKGHEDFVRAAKAVLKQYKGAKFVIIGDDISESKEFLNLIKNLLVELKMQDKFIITGWQENVLEFVNGLDVVVQPSIEPEPFGLTVIEAMALKKPVIGSRMGALPELISDEEDGLLFEPKNWDDLGSKIVKLLKDDALRQQMGERARKKIENKFVIDQNIAQVQSIIQEVVS